MRVSGQAHIPAVLFPVKCLLLSIEQVKDWAPVSA
jgi:hypothetical protein